MWLCAAQAEEPTVNQVDCALPHALTANVGSHRFGLFESFVVNEPLLHHERREEHEDEGKRQTQFLRFWPLWTLRSLW